MARACQGRVGEVGRLRQLTVGQPTVGCLRYSEQKSAEEFGQGNPERPKDQVKARPDVVREGTIDQEGFFTFEI